MTLRIALLGAFPYPLSQGSQVFVGQQVRALAAAGHDVTLVCYGRGQSRGGGDASPKELASGDDFPVARVARWLSPRSLRAGPSPGKPLADAALVATCVAAHRRRPFDVVLAHNGEAGIAGVLARRFTSAPVVYVAHTLLGRELSSYWGAAAPSGGSRSHLAAGRVLDGIGQRLDTWLARHCDAVVALCEVSAHVLGANARGPVAVIPPGLEREAPPAPDTVARACRDLGLEPRSFALYTGNLDGYQDLADLETAARMLAEQGGAPVVIATHGAATARGDDGPLRRLRVDRQRARLLEFGCAVALLPRRQAGGFPVKTLNYMEAARPIVARRGVVDGLEHGESAWLLDADEGPDELARAIAELVGDRSRADRLGRGGHEQLETLHRWPDLARRTIRLLDRVVAGSRSRRKA